MKAAKPAYSFSLATNPSPTRARRYPLNINPNPTRNPKVFRDPSGSGRVADLYTGTRSPPGLAWKLRLPLGMTKSQGPSQGPSATASISTTRGQTARMASIATTRGAAWNPGTLELATAGGGYLPRSAGMRARGQQTRGNPAKLPSRLAVG